MIVAPRQSHHWVIASIHESPSHNKKIATSPCDLTQPIMLFRGSSQLRAEREALNYNRHCEAHIILQMIEE